MTGRMCGRRDALPEGGGAPPYVAVVGGVNVDIGGRSAGLLAAGDSNPGRVRVSLGGVGRNIAHNLVLLGCNVRMLTALGDDLHAQRIAASCGELGIDLSAALCVPGAATSAYLFIEGRDGEMAMAVSDMEICEEITPAYLEGCRAVLNGARLVVVDANIPARSILWLCEHVGAPIFADPVSTAKAERLRPALGRLHTLKPNRLEAELLSGVSITDGESLKKAADCLLDAGLRRVFISLGGEGVYAADRERAVRLPCLPAETRGVTGAGDAFMAALVWAHLEGEDMERAARLAMAAAAAALEGEAAVNPRMSAAELKRRIQ